MLEYDVDSKTYLGSGEDAAHHPFHAFRIGQEIHIVYHLNQPNQHVARADVGKVVNNIDDYLWTPFAEFALAESVKESGCIHAGSTGVSATVIQRWLDGNDDAWTLAIANAFDRLTLPGDEATAIAQRLVSHPSDEVRAAMAKSRMLSGPLIQQLAEDDSVLVAQRAGRTMARLSAPSDRLTETLEKSGSMADLMLLCYRELERRYQGDYSGDSSGHYTWEAGPASSTGRRLTRQAMSGLMPGRLTLLAGESDADLTSLALSIALGELSRREASGGVSMISCRHPAPAVGMRMLSMQSGVALEQLRNGNFSSAHWRKLASAAGALADLDMHIVADHLTPNELLLACKREAAVDGILSLLIIDRAEQMDSVNCDEDGKAAFEHAIDAIRSLAVEMQLPVLVTVSLPAGITGAVAERVKHWSAAAYEKADRVLSVSPHGSRAKVDICK